MRNGVRAGIRKPPTLICSGTRAGLKATGRARLARAGTLALLLLGSQQLAASSGSASAISSAPASAPASDLSLESWEAADLARVDTLRVATKAEAALALIDLLRPRARPGSAFLLALRLREGELRTSIGQTRAGEEVLRPALSLAWALGDTAQACAILRWLAVAVGGQGRLAESTTLCRRLLDLARSRQDRRHEGWALVGLAWGAGEDGHLLEAAENYREAARVFWEAGDPRSESWARNGLGSVEAEVGAYGEARATFETAASLARATGYRMVEALSANNLGTLEYGLGDPGVAVDWFASAAAIHRSLGEARIALFPMMNLALCEAELGHYGAAADTLDSLLTRCRREGYKGGEEASVLLKLADVRALQGRRGEADRLRRAAVDPSLHAPLRNRIEAAVGIALSLAERDSAQAAVALLEETRAALPDPCDPEALGPARDGPRPDPDREWIRGSRP